ncbi:MAG: ATP-dependent dethiobiotin synthetase BioD [Chlamydiae bacterium]|nr:ATP-dependent dethiobiotin synthetase BioD [Chlamydiota bacterium]
MKNIVVAGTGTDVGKTVVSAILLQMFEADYWKPVSCGSNEDRDSFKVKQLVNIPNFCCHPEAYHFSSPKSPHHAAAIESIEPLSSKLCLPNSNRQIIIESAGGVLVPLNNKELLTDIFCNWDCNWVLVSRNQLGSINHTLLSYEALVQRSVNILGIIFNGSQNDYTEKFITDYTGLSILGRVDEESNINSEIIMRYSEKWKNQNCWRERI